MVLLVVVTILSAEMLLMGVCFLTERRGLLRWACHFDKLLKQSFISGKVGSDEGIAAPSVRDGR